VDSTVFPPTMICVTYTGAVDGGIETITTEPPSLLCVKYPGMIEGGLGSDCLAGLPTRFLD